MYKHTLKISNGEIFTWENNSDKVLPCSYTDNGNTFFYYKLYNPNTEENFIIPANNVVLILTKKIGG